MNKVIDINVKKYTDEINIEWIEQLPISDSKEHIEIRNM